MKTKFSIFLMAILFISCLEEEQQPRAYYQFNKNDNKFIIKNQYEGQEFLYKNQHGDTKLVKLVRNNNDKHKLYTESGGLFATYSYFYYDRYELVYHFKDSLTQYIFSLEWRRFPMDYAQAIHNINTVLPSKFEFYIPFFRYLNPEVSNENWNLKVDITEPPISMEVEGVNYNRVFIIHRNTSLNGAEYEPALYLDLTYGIIGFDDKDGNLWRITHQKSDKLRDL